MLKKWGIICSIFIVLLVGCKNKTEVDSVIVEGVVLKVDQQRVLISQKETFKAEDFEKSLEDILLDPSYNLMWVNDVNEPVKVKTKIRATLEGAILESYPPMASAKKVEILGEVELVKESTDMSYNEELRAIFPQTINLEQRYSGYTEYGHVQKLIEINEEDNALDYVFAGEMHDGYGDFDNRKFKLIYSIDADSITETVQNEDPYSMLQQPDLLVSIIPNKIILKAPLEVGNSWVQSFSYKGETYSAKTSITKALKNEEGKMEYETLTLVEGIEGYYQEVYKESRVFVEGTGLTSFSNLFSIQAVGEEITPNQQSEDLYMFGFGLSDQRLVE